MLAWKAGQGVGGRARRGRLVKVRMIGDREGQGLGADRKRNARRTVRAGKLFVVLLAAAFALAGCGGSTGTDA